MKITQSQLRRIIREEKQRLLTETMLEWEDHPDIPDYIMGSVIPTLTEMVAAAGFVGNVSEDIVMDKLLDCMSAIAQELGVVARPEGPGREYITLRDPSGNIP